MHSKNQLNASEPRALRSIIPSILDDIVTACFTSVENPSLKQNRDFEDYNQYVQGKNSVIIDTEHQMKRSSHLNGNSSLPQSMPQSTKNKHRFDPLRSGPIAYEKNYNLSTDFAHL